MSCVGDGESCGGSWTKLRSDVRGWRYLNKPWLTLITLSSRSCYCTSLKKGNWSFWQPSIVDKEAVIIKYWVFYNLCGVGTLSMQPVLILIKKTSRCCEFGLLTVRLPEWCCLLLCPCVAPCLCPDIICSWITAAGIIPQGYESSWFSWHPMICSLGDPWLWTMWLPQGGWVQGDTCETCPLSERHRWLCVFICLHPWSEPLKFHINRVPKNIDERKMD